MVKHRVIIPNDLSPYPEKYETSAAAILSKYFNCDIYFLTRSTLRSPDIEINNIKWELKSPTGNGKRTIEHQIQRALPQSRNIIIDARRTKLHINKIHSALNKCISDNHKIQHLILIEKSKKVVVLK